MASFRFVAYGCFSGLGGRQRLGFLFSDDFLLCMHVLGEGGRDLGVTNNKVSVRAGYMGGLSGPWSAASGQ
jgi:hypothetical protein